MTRKPLRAKSLAAVHGAIIAMALTPIVHAADPSAPNSAARALTSPTDVVEVGAGYVSDRSLKFGQYNGLFNQGIYGIFNFDLRGGGAYDSGDPTRWRIVGTDLGLDTRNVSGEYGQQGAFRITGSFDQLRSNRSDTYQTPYMGDGTNTLTLPSTWVVPRVPQLSTTAGNFRGLSPVTGLAPVVVGGILTQPTATQQATVNSTIAADVPAFHNVDLATKRTTEDVGFNYNINSRWDIKASAKHQTRDGVKALNMLSLVSGTSAVTLPDLIDQTTDQYNVALNYTGENAFFQAAYYGSVFKNSVGSMTWQNPFIQTPTFSTMSSAPSNEFHQFSLTGGYKFSPTSKLVLNASYGRGTQNDTFLADPGNSPLGVPVSSLNGRVDWTSFLAKFTARPTKGLNFLASYKYDDRDNRTPVNTYEFYDAGEPKSATASPFNAALGLPAGTLGSNINIYANRPYSKKVNQATIEGDYAIASGNWLKAGYQYEQIERSCPGSWINCADAPKTRENTLRAEWRFNAMEDLNGRLGYARSQRTVDYDENAWLALVPMANVVPAGGATTSVLGFFNQTGLGGFGPVAPFVPLQSGDLGIFFPNNSALPQGLYGSRNDIHEIIGMRRFNMADRDRDKVRSSINWQASERVSVQGALDYNKDNYKNSVFGLTDAQSWALNLDGTFAVNDALSASAYYTYEDQRSQSAGASYASGTITNAAFVGQAGNSLVSGGCFSTVTLKNQNAKIDPCLNWSTDMRDKVDTFGAAFNYRGLMGGRLDLLGDLIYTHARTNNDVRGGQYVNNPFAAAAPAPALPAGTPAVFFIPGTALPTVTTKTVEFRLSGLYAIDPQSAVRVAYWFQRLTSNDYSFEGMQYGTITSVIPTNEQPFSYRVHVIGVSYLYQWR
jgi:MtrB/PioB family decaheme-associated outer membrane protein